MNSKDNGAIGDKSFAEKRAGIKKSKIILLTKQVVEITKRSGAVWGRDQIFKRQTKLADLAVDRWPLQGR